MNILKKIKGIKVFLLSTVLFICFTMTGCLGLIALFSVGEETETEQTMEPVELEEPVKEELVEITPQPTLTVTPESTVEPIPELVVTEAPKEVIQDSSMAVHFLDVGQGLSILIQCDGQTMIFDGGDRETSSMVVAYLKNAGIETIDYLICSHYDSDHVAGLIGCLNVFPVKQVIASDYVHDTKLYDSFVSKVKEQNLTMMHPEVGETFSLGAAEFTILAPESIAADNSNENSIAIKLTHGENSFVITGDAEKNSEAAMCRSGIELSCDVLVAGHHGSATASTWDFLMKTVPEYAVISCGEGNSYGHPHEETMEKFASMETQIYRTDKQGFISVVSDGKELIWSQEPGNDYSVGVPYVEEATPEPTKEPTPEPVAEGGTDYVLNTNTEKFHYPSCGSVKKMKDKNKEFFTGTRDEVIAMGYDPCGNCHP